MFLTSDLENVGAVAADRTIEVSVTQVTPRTSSRSSVGNSSAQILLLCQNMSLETFNLYNIDC